MMEHKVVGNGMVFFTPEQLEDSPSRRDGMSADEERARRREAQQIIMDVCQSMHIHVQYAYVAVYLCFRYYAVRPWNRSDRFLIMAAALSLALKMRESPKPVFYIIQEFERRRWRDYERTRPSGEPRRSHDKLYIESLKEPFCIAERALLFAIGFQFGIGDPYPHVARQLRALGLSDDADRAAKIDVQQMAYCFLRDSLCTTLCLRYPPEKIAATAVYLAFQVLRRPLGLSAEGAEEGEAVDAPRPFCEVCNILPTEIIEIANEITANYVAALRHAPVPLPSPLPPGSARKAVALPALESKVVGDRWTIAPKAENGAGSGGGAAEAGAAAAPVPMAVDGRGGGSHSGEEGAVSASGRQGEGRPAAARPAGGTAPQWPQQRLPPGGGQLAPSTVPCGAGDGAATSPAGSPALAGRRGKRPRPEAGDGRPQGGGGGVVWSPGQSHQSSGSMCIMRP